MEVKIPKEIQSYHESVFFGLSARQFFCSALAVAAAVGIYFLARGVLGRETASWLCLIGAAPFAAAGFFSYNGLTLEKFLWTVFKSEVLFSARRVYRAENYYYQLLIAQNQKNRSKKDIKYNCKNRRSSNDE
ncbi:MAG: PrgI family protein [Clostridiaceae bacterium]|nr:PrgI family protein [Clostridiaceae bacterium]